MATQVAVIYKKTDDKTKVIPLGFVDQKIAHKVIEGVADGKKGTKAYGWHLFMGEPEDVVFGEPIQLSKL